MKPTILGVLLVTVCIAAGCASRQAPPQEEGVLEGFETSEDSRQAEVLLDQTEAWVEQFDGTEGTSEGRIVISCGFTFSKRDIKVAMQTNEPGGIIATLSLTDKGTGLVIAENVRWLEGLAKAFAARMRAYSAVLVDPRTITIARRK